MTDCNLLFSSFTSSSASVVGERLDYSLPWISDWASDTWPLKFIITLSLPDTRFSFLRAIDHLWSKCLVFISPSPNNVWLVFLFGQFGIKHPRFWIKRKAHLFCNYVLPYFSTFTLTCIRSIMKSLTVTSLTIRRWIACVSQWRTGKTFRTSTEDEGDLGRQWSFP